MRLRYRNQPVKALAAYRVNHPLADRVRLWRSRWRFQHVQAQRPDGFIQMLCENAIVIVNQVTVGVVEANNFSHLLQSPISAWVRRNIDPHQSATTMLDNHKKHRAAGRWQSPQRRSHTLESLSRGSSGTLPTAGHPRGWPAGGFSMYFRTVRGETRMPNFTNNSLAIRSSPQIGFSRAILRISARNSTGIRGRLARHFHRQNKRHPARCHRMIDFGCTTYSASRQLKKLAKIAKLIRVAASTRRGLIPRSLNSPNCRRRKRFSASTDRVGLNRRIPNPAASASS